MLYDGSLWKEKLKGGMGGSGWFVEIAVVKKGFRTRWVRSRRLWEVI